MSELSGLELRKAVCLALGYTFQSWLNTDGDNVMRLFDPAMKLLKWAYLIGEKERRQVKWRLVENLVRRIQTSRLPTKSSRLPRTCLCMEDSSLHPIPRSQ